MENRDQMIQMMSNITKMTPTRFTNMIKEEPKKKKDRFGFLVI